MVDRAGFRAFLLLKLVPKSRADIRSVVSGMRCLSF